MRKYWRKLFIVLFILLVCLSGALWFLIKTHKEGIAKEAEVIVPISLEMQALQAELKAWQQAGAEMVCLPRHTWKNFNSIRSCRFVNPQTGCEYIINAWEISGEGFSEKFPRIKDGKQVGCKAENPALVQE